MRGEKNVGTIERWVSGLGGATLALWGLRRASLPGLAVAAAGAALAWRGLSGWCNVYDALGIDRAVGTPTVGNLGVKIDREITVAAPPERLYYFWRNFENLPRIMSHVESVQILSETRSRWRVKAPAGTTVEWEAEIINDRPPHVIAWRTRARCSSRRPAAQRASRFRCNTIRPAAPSPTPWPRSWTPTPVAASSTT